MARTPLFRLIERSLALAFESLARGEPPDELVERRREEKWDRRRFLAASASAAASLALSRCAPFRSARSDPGNGSVLVFGAGIAGLTAAYRLKQSGIGVRIYEASNRVGGRIFSLRDRFADGQVAELGGELVDTNHAAIRGLASELGIPLDDLADEDPSVGRDLWFFGGRRRSEREVVEAFRPIAARIRADVATIGGDGTVGYNAPNGAEPLDRISIAEWLTRAGADGWIRQLLEVGYTTEYGLEIDRQSALNLLLLIDPEPDPFRIYGESDERFHVRGGNDSVTRALASSLGDEIQTATSLEAISRRADGLLSCSVRTGGSTRAVSGDHVLLAIPFTMLRSVRLDLELPPAKRRAIAELSYGTNAKLMAGFSERVWRTRHGSNGSVLTDLPFQLTWETSRRQPGRSGILTNFTGGDHGLELGRGSAAEQARRLVEDLERVFPGAAAARPGMPEARFHWPTHPFTLGSYACYGPGQWTAFHGAEGERVGPLHFAGEHCSLEAQGFMEGGCETAEAAAREIREDLGVARRTAA